MAWRRWHCGDGDGCFANVVSGRNAAVPNGIYDSADKVVPRAAQLAGGIGLVYTVFNIYGQPCSPLQVCRILMRWLTQ